MAGVEAAKVVSLYYLPGRPHSLQPTGLLKISFSMFTIRPPMFWATVNLNPGNIKLDIALLLRRRKLLVAGQEKKLFLWCNKRHLSSHSNEADYNKRTPLMAGEEAAKVVSVYRKADKSEEIHLVINLPARE